MSISIIWINLEYQSLRCLKKNRFVYRSRVADDDEPDIFHIFVRNCLNIFGFYAANAVQELKAVSPAAADQLVTCEFAGLGRVRFLPQIIICQKLACHSCD